MLLVVLASIFYFLNRKNPINQAFALLLLLLAYFGSISVLVISFQVIPAHWSILLMPVLCYIGFVFHLFIKAVLGATTLLARGERIYFTAGLIFSVYAAYKLLYPVAAAELRATSQVIDHVLHRTYTREPIYALYILYMFVPIVYAGFRLVRAVRAPTSEEREMQGLARMILVIFSVSVGWAILALAVPPMLGKPQSPAAGSFALIGSVVAYSYTLLRHRAWRIEALTEKLRIRESQLSDRNRTIERDLDLAREIHRKVLPGMNLDGSGLECSLFYEPMEKVGGDFYDLTRAGNKYRLIIADVSGHGVAAGFFSAMSSLILRSVWSDPSRSLNEIACLFNDQLTDYSVKGIFVSAMLVELDTLSDTASLVNAGHPPAFCISESIVRQLGGNGRLLGVTSGNDFRSEQFEFRKGDTLFLYTDGLIEATNAAGEEFGFVRLREQLENSTRLSLGSRERYVIRELAAFHGPRAYEDDLTVIQVRKLPPS